MHAVGAEPSTLTIDDPGAPRGRVVSVPCLFVVMHADAPATSPARHMLAEVDEVRIGRAASPLRVRDKDAGRDVLRLGMVDRWMSASHAALRRTKEGWVLEDEGSKNGTFVRGERVTRAVITDGTFIEIGRTFCLFRASVPLAPTTARDASIDELRPVVDHLATLAEPLGAAFEALTRVAASSLAVLVRGESGTGKEGVARAVHTLSRRKGRFVAVNCGAIAENLIESELFGHKRGAFSGATDDKPGLVRASDGGTLFLDEIGDLPLAAQAALLRVLQEREVLPVGATQPVAVDLRVVAATHRDLDRATFEKAFRPDLLARLRGYVLNLPPLRERREDFGLITRALLERVAPGRLEEISFEPGCARALLAHDWPTNMRELEQSLSAALVVSGTGPLALEHFPQLTTAAADSPTDDEPALTEEDVARRAELERLLDEHGGNVSAVAREMGKARMQIQRWMKRYKLRDSS